MGAPGRNARGDPAIAFEVAFAATVVYLPALHTVFGTAALRPDQLAVVLPFPLIVWGCDELVRLARRTSARRASARSARTTP